jgi:hypothetical protein
MLFQGEPYAEFKEEWDDYLERPPPVAEAIRLINTQTEIVEEVRRNNFVLISLWHNTRCSFVGLEPADDDERSAQAVCFVLA